ncbi:hypothetical protein K435DRAFT_366917 [Dendrothele bispora CBS 962.96]|uniref:F-box domain-containing protein n=1 Tax=Dendrothele bispora (strain CBS 962.96) TaxID=1314807 RepID=A0A4S8LCH4_DENBC|nr:hypothetical protein K435DRAFT_366917 [Dendrothele bispora CBS 962.96]
MAGFVWNTPTRQNGDRLLPVIPCEIYEEIIAYIEPSDELGLHNCKQIWLSLAKVCRYFCAETMRRFYQSIILSGNSSSDADQQSPASYFNFCSQVRKGVGPRAGFSVDVKECLLAYWYSAMVLDLFLDEKVGKALVRMDNLATLSLLKIPVTPTLLKVIRRLKNLESLNMQACTFEGVTVDHLNKLSSLKLKQLSVMNSTMRSIPMDLALAMGVLIENLEELRTNNCLVLKALLSVSKRKPIPLQVLNLELKFIADSELVSLCDFLDTTPTITDLRFHIPFAPIHFANLSTSALLKLAKVQAPLHFLKSLASRPLIELHQTCNQFDDPLLSSGPLLSNINGQSLSVLSLSWDLLKERPFQECFPQLHTLTLLDVYELVIPRPPGFIDFVGTHISSMITIDICYRAQPLQR